MDYSIIKNNTKNFSTQKGCLIMKKSVKEILKLFAMEEIRVPLDLEESKILNLYRDCKSKYKKEYKKEYKIILKEYKDKLLNDPDFYENDHGNIWYKFKNILRYNIDNGDIDFFDFTLELSLDKKTKKVFKKNYYDDINAVTVSPAKICIDTNTISNRAKKLGLYDIRRFLISEVSKSLKYLDTLYSTSMLVPDFPVFDKRSNLLCAEDIELIAEKILLYIIYTVCGIDTLFECDENWVDIIKVPLVMHPEYSIKISAPVGSDEKGYDEENDEEDSDDDEEGENESDVIKSVILDSLFKDSNNDKSDSSEETTAKANEDASKPENESEGKTDDTGDV